MTAGVTRARMAPLSIDTVNGRATIDSVHFSSHVSIALLPRPSYNPGYDTVQCASAAGFLPLLGQLTSVGDVSKADFLGEQCPAAAPPWPRPKRGHHGAMQHTACVMPPPHHASQGCARGLWQALPLTTLEHVVLVLCRCCAARFKELDESEHYHICVAEGAGGPWGAARACTVHAPTEALRGPIGGQHAEPRLAVWCPC